MRVLVGSEYCKVEIKRRILQPVSFSEYAGPQGYGNDCNPLDIGTMSVQ